MALSRVKVWIAGEVLTASDLNTEFNNILNNGEDLVFPASKAIDFNGNQLILDADADTSITSDTDDQIDYELGGFDAFAMKTVASAVNLLTYTAAATGNDVSFTASGSDTDVGLDIITKGEGTFKINGQTVKSYIQLAKDIQKGLAGFQIARSTELRTQNIQQDANVILANRVFS